MKVVDEVGKEKKVRGVPQYPEMSFYIVTMRTT
jgi:hypothetical protein